MISPNHTEGSSYTIAPLSRLSLMLAIARAREVGFNRYAAALVRVYMHLYPEDVRPTN